MALDDNPKLREIRAIKDPVERAREAQAFIDRGRRAIDDAQGIRNDAIREARGTTRLTVDAIAEAIKARRNVVVDALRVRK